MIALFDFTPQFCPNCGDGLQFHDHMARSDYNSHCSHTCDCGLHFQKASSDLLLKAAAEEGDMPQYHYEY